MKIILFSMGEQCPHCVQAEKLLAKEISEKIVKVVDAAEAQGKAKGFPYFEYNSKSHTGCPKSKEQLFQKLGYNPVLREPFTTSDSKKTLWKILGIIIFIGICITLMLACFYYFRKKPKNSDLNITNNFMTSYGKKIY